MAIAEAMREAVRRHLEKELHSDVTLEVFTDRRRGGDEGSEAAAQALRELVDDVGRLSSHVQVLHHDWAESHERARSLGIVRPAAIAFVAPNVRGRMIQYGTPAGYEFRSFLAGIIAAAHAGESALGDAAKELLGRLPEELHLQVFTSPGCPHCPRMVGVAYNLAAKARGCSVDAIDATEFRELAQRYDVKGIPLTVVNDGCEVVGAMTLEAFLKKLIRENVPSRRPSAS